VSLNRVDLVGTGARRVALAATGIVGAMYLLIAVAVVLIVTHNLVANIDSQISSTATAEAAQHSPAHESDFGPPPGKQTQFGAPLLCWRVLTTGDVFTCPGASGAPVPTQYASIAQPTTISVRGTDIRAAGARASDGDYIIVGQTMDGVYQARWNLMVAEIMIGPVLLVIVFLGALAIGRRVAAPVERARQRQMEFTANASHELRTPLSVIQAQTTLALSQPREEQWYRRAFERVNEESMRMRRLVDDLLWLARFDATRGQAQAEPVDLGVLAQQAVDRFTAIAEARQLRLAVRLFGDSLVIASSPEWLDHLVGVLLDNACKYTPEHGSVDVAVTGEGDRVRLVVDDSGPGIPMEQRQAIFDRFHRASDAPGGTGLGLAIADAVVRGTNGRWEIGTSPAGGASIAVIWPRLLTNAKATPATTAGPAVRPQPES
jgi:signal transduction histidine kinase